MPDSLDGHRLSIPDVLEEYGNPKFGEFLVLPGSRGETRQEGAAASDCAGPQDYRLAIDRPLLKSQREWLVAIRESIAGAVEDGDDRIHVKAEDLGLLDGLIDLTDEIADQAAVSELRESGDADP